MPLSLTFRTKTNTVFALALLALAVIGALSFRETARLVASEKLVSHSREVLESAALMSSHLSGAVSARRGYLLFAKPWAADQFAIESHAAQADFRELLRLTADNATQGARLGDLKPLIESRLAILNQSIQLHQKSGTKDDRDAQSAFSAQGAELADQIWPISQAFHDTETTLLTQRQADTAAASRQSFCIETVLAVSFFGVLIAAVWFINREISLREHAERESVEKGRLLRSVLDSSSDAILVADGRGSIILRNAVAARYHLRAPANLPPEEWAYGYGIYRSDKQTPFPVDELPLVRAALHGQSVDNVEVYIRPPGWETGRWHLSSSRPLLDGAGRVHGGVVVLRDITARKFLEEDRERLLLELCRVLGQVKLDGFSSNGSDGLYSGTQKKNGIN